MDWISGGRILTRAGQGENDTILALKTTQNMRIILKLILRNLCIFINSYHTKSPTFNPKSIITTFCNHVFPQTDWSLFSTFAFRGVRPTTLFDIPHMRILCQAYSNSVSLLILMRNLMSTKHAPKSIEVAAIV